MVQSLGAAFLMVTIGLLSFPTTYVISVLDSFALAGAVVVLVRYGRSFVISSTERNPDPPHILISGIFLIALAIALIRVLRQFGIELGTLSSSTASFIFAYLTAIMTFGLFLKVAAPSLPVEQGRKQSLSPWQALVLALVCGTVLAVLVLLTREALD